MSNNMAIWDANKTIPEQYIKTAKVKGMTISSFSLASVVMMATKQFGPIGKGWGYEVVEERDDEGAIIQKAVTHENGDEQPEVREIVHTLIIKLWYMLGDERVEMPIQAGHTPKLMRTKYGPQFDDEYYKKTLADAIKKSLSMLGFGADIFLGLMDNPEYQAVLAEERQLVLDSQKSDRIKELTELCQEYASAYKANTMAHSLAAQLQGHTAEVNMFCRKHQVDAAPFISGLNKHYQNRVEELKKQKESKK